MIERIIQSIMSMTSPSSGDNLTGFEIDASHYFGSNEGLVNATVARTNEPSCMLEMRGEVAEQIISLPQLSSILKEIWQNLAYLHFQATSVEWYKEATVMRFVTVISDEAFYVTGSMVVNGRYHLKLAEEFEKGFGRRLPSFPSAV